MSRLRSTSVILTAAFFIPGVSACSDSQDTNVDTSEVCMDEKTQLRAPDEDCENGDSDRTWIYFHGTGPAVGYPVPHGYSRVKLGIVGRVPATGGRAVSSGS